MPYFSLDDKIYFTSAGIDREFEDVVSIHPELKVYREAFIKAVEDIKGMPRDDSMAFDVEYGDDDDIDMSAPDTKIKHKVDGKMKATKNDHPQPDDVFQLDNERFVEMSEKAGIEPKRIIQILQRGGLMDKEGNISRDDAMSGPMPPERELDGLAAEFRTKSGTLHNMKGPARMWLDGTEEYYISGRRMSQLQWEQEISKHGGRSGASDNVDITKEKVKEKDESKDSYEGEPEEI